MRLLGIESSCDETAAAVVSDQEGVVRIGSSLIASQHELHERFGGIVPELASRRHIEVILPLIRSSLEKAQVTLREIDGVAVTHRPGLLGSLLVGLQVGKGIAFARGISFIGISHLEGHLIAPMLENPSLQFPYVALLVSGGHTLLYLVREIGSYEFIGGTRDDAAGEAFDKVARLLGLGYPGGPVIDRLAQTGNPQAIRFPRGTIKDHPFDFSFSGLKTAVQNYLKKSGGANNLPNICASFQETVVEDLVEKTLRAAEEEGVSSIAVSGGVACNRRLREKMPQAFFPSPSLCTDNAAMIAACGLFYLKKGVRSPWSLNAQANQDVRLS